MRELLKIDSREPFISPMDYSVGETVYVDGEEYMDYDNGCGCDVERQCTAHADVYTAGGACDCNADKACVECIDDGVYERPDTIKRNAAFYDTVARMNGYADAEQMRYYEFDIH